MNQNDFNETVLVRFEPSGWRTTGEAQAPKSLESAYNDAVQGTNNFLDEYGIASGRGGVVRLNSEQGYQFVAVVMPANLLTALGEQPFVAREYPDQTKSTLQVMSL